MPYRILVTTHHITSRAKVTKLRQAAELHNVSALLKSGPRPPGVMICEGQVEDVKQWHATLKKLRYKDYCFMGGEEVDKCIVNGGKAGLREVGTKKELGDTLGEDGRLWWRTKMGWTKDERA
jgi:hypothetical protein